MSISNMIKVGLITLIVSVFFSGCATKLQTDRKIGTLNLKSEKLQISEPITNVIAVVSPKISQTNISKSSVENATGFQAMMMNQMKMSNAKYNFSEKFQNSYASRLDKALESSTSEILSSKGFKLKGPYAIFEDMTYKDKKIIYLAFVPKIDFTIDNKIIKSENHRLYSHSEGVVQIGGSFTISMVEPMTGQVFIKKRINLSDFGIEEHYVYEKQTREGGGLSIDTAMDKATAPDILIDTTDIALTNAINKFYKNAIVKINKYLDREEILSFEQDILNLKGLKRF